MWVLAFVFMALALTMGSRPPGLAASLYVCGLGLFMAPFLIPVVGAWLRALHEATHLVVLKWELDTHFGPDFGPGKVMFTGVVANNTSEPATGVVLHLILRPKTGTDSIPDSASNPKQEIMIPIRDLAPKQRRKCQRTFEFPPWNPLNNLEVTHHLDCEGNRCGAPTLRTRDEPSLTATRNRIRDGP